MGGAQPAASWTFLPTLNAIAGTAQQPGIWRKTAAFVSGDFGRSAASHIHLGRCEFGLWWRAQHQDHAKRHLVRTARDIYARHRQPVRPCSRDSALPIFWRCPAAVRRRRIRGLPLWLRHGRAASTLSQFREYPGLLRLRLSRPIWSGFLAQRRARRTVRAIAQRRSGAIRRRRRAERRAGGLAQRTAPGIRQRH